ncbi:MAG: hypothetical protein F9K30_13940 [Dechloromonas sp.]|nr:MAG: hypothetical protein F9K30_13940 [Dechloromonas sp.]
MSNEKPVFVLGAEDTFTAIARAMRPNDDDGFDIIPVKCRFRALGRKRQNELASSLDGDHNVLEAALISASVTTMQDKDGNPVEWGPAVRDDMLDRQYFKAAILQVYLDRMNGTKRGN